MEHDASKTQTTCADNAHPASQSWIIISPTKDYFLARLLHMNISVVCLVELEANFLIKLASRGGGFPHVLLIFPIFLYAEDVMVRFLSIWNTSILHCTKKKPTLSLIFVQQYV